jgi:acyl carrier protein phosphodiesterase
MIIFIDRYQGNGAGALNNLNRGLSLNFLAHIYLSGDSDEIKIGNFIGDYVKGRNYENYPELVNKGIILHREIDSFTDSHPVVNRSKMHLKQRFRRYSGVIVDIFYDHFLASEWAMFSKHPLPQYVIHMYEILVSNYFILPNEIKAFLPFFVINNWLESYTSIEGIEGVLRRMTRRTSLPNETTFAISELRKNYHLFRDDFLCFFPDLIEYVEKTHDIPVSGFHSPTFV